MEPKLIIVVPCYNEEEALPITSKTFLEKLHSLADKKLISSDSRIMFINDGSKDRTWEIISSLAERDEHFMGISLSRNQGHQNAVLAGLMEAKDICDITISIDCDGQDDINAMDKMVEEYLGGCDIVYGVRTDRKSDSFFKRATAQGFYKVLRFLGAEVVYNHADYRLISSRALQALAEFKEVNLFLRGMVPLVGFKSTSVGYERRKRLAGKSHYPLMKMLSFAFDGITSLSTKPIKIIFSFGMIVTFLSFVGIIWAVLQRFFGDTIDGWTSIICILCFFSGVQLISIGVIGEYVGKTYLEAKARPRYIIGERTGDITKSNSDVGGEKCNGITDDSNQ